MSLITINVHVLIPQNFVQSNYQLVEITRQYLNNCHVPSPPPFRRNSSSYSNKNDPNPHNLCCFTPTNSSLSGYTSCFGVQISNNVAKIKKSMSSSFIVQSFLLQKSQPCTTTVVCVSSYSPCLLYVSIVRHDNCIPSRIAVGWEDVSTPLPLFHITIFDIQ